jgi:hypothetical protein
MYKIIYLYFRYFGILHSDMHLSRRVLTLANPFEYYAKFQPTPVTLKSLIDFGMFKRVEEKKKIIFYLKVLMAILNIRINFYVLNYLFDGLICVKK